MPMQPRPWPEGPSETARVTQSAFRKGSLAIRARDELGAWCDDAAYGARGPPGSSPAQLAMVTVLQFTENLTDRQAAYAVRSARMTAWAGAQAWRRAVISRSMSGVKISCIASSIFPPGTTMMFGRDMNESCSIDSR